MTNLNQRVTALERTGSGQVVDTQAPHRYAAALKQLGLYAPPVLEGQTGPEYLKTIPTESIKAMMEAGR